MIPVKLSSATGFKMKDIIGRLNYKYFLTLLLSLGYAFGGSVHAAPSADTLSPAGTMPTLALPPIEPVKTDSVYSESTYRKVAGKKAPPINIYDMPYSMTDNYTNGRMLRINTGILAAAGVLTLGILQTLPEGATNWNKKSISEIPFFKRWSTNVGKGPVWDKDGFVFNYILHPYGGAVYYMAARSQGLNLFYSFLYSAGVSTLLWEYGVEAFMEVPSTQDLFVTPLAGLVLGEGFYLLKRHIVANDYRLFGSGVVGNVIAYLIDPVNEVVGIFAGNPNRRKPGSPDRSLVCTPMLSTTGNGKLLGFTASLTF